MVLHLSFTHAAYSVGRSKGHHTGAAIERVTVHALLAGSSRARVEEIDLAVSLGFPARLLIKEPDLLDMAVLDQLRLQIRIRRPPVEVPDEERGSAGAVAAPAVANNDRSSPEVAPSLPVERVSSRLDLVVGRRRWRRGDGRLRRRREMGRVGAVLDGGGDGGDTGDVDLLRLLPHRRQRRGQRERRGRKHLLLLRRRLLRRGLVLLGRQRRRLGLDGGLGGVEEAVPDVDVVVEVVVVVVVAVVLVDVLDGGDGLLPVEGAVPVGIHGGGGGDWGDEANPRGWI